MYTGYDEKHLCKKQHGINYQVSEQHDAALSMMLACRTSKATYVPFTIGQSHSCTV